MNPLFFREIKDAFLKIRKNEKARVVILGAEGKMFTAGLDLKEAASILAST